MILLDLNMPRKDGRTALKEIKADPELRQIPVTVLTTSKADEDIFRSYDLGVNSYIVKPVTFEALVDILQTLEKYWFEIVELPPDAVQAQADTVVGRGAGGSSKPRREGAPANPYGLPLRWTKFL